MGFGTFGGTGGGGYAIEETIDDLNSWGLELFGDPTRYITFASFMNPVCSDDADPQVLYFPKSLYIPSGVTMTPSNRCKGLYVFVNGNLLIDGTISMSARGASATGVDTPLTARLKMPRTIVRSVSRETKRAEDIVERVFGTVGTVPAIGAAGGASKSSPGGGINGSAGTGRRCGGGGSGGVYNSGTSGRGGTGTSFSGGAGGGGGSGGTGGDGSDTGGAGGNGGGDYHAAGGAGNPRGSGGRENFASDGTGGVLFLVVRGSLYVGSGGVIQANGSPGKEHDASGGGSGGGSINVIYGVSFSNRGSVVANGGVGGAGYHDREEAGGSGGAGCVTIEQVARLVA